jgi:hypothetical protein
MVKPVDPAQGAFDFGENPEKPQRGKAGPSPFDEILTREEKAREKAKDRAVENKEFEDKRQPKSDLIRQTEIARMKEILDKSKGGGSGGGGGMPKLNRDITKNYKAGGKVSSASKRADGCAIKGKTKGRIV